MWLRFNLAKDALFLDIDGTILDIAPTAHDVVVPKTLVDSLDRLQHKLNGALAFLSGRTIQDIDRLFAPLRFPCAGAHGAEWRLSSGGPINSIAPLSESLRMKISGTFANMAGVRVEDKGYTIAVHYRQSPELAEKIKKALGEHIDQSEIPLTLIPGRKVFEIAMPSHNKGQALERFIKTAPFKNRRPVFLGDDITDIAAMGACLKNGGIAARIGNSKANLNAFANPEAVRRWINDLTKI